MGKKKQPNEATKASMNKFFEYYKDTPIQKYAAAHAGVNQNTITDWKTRYPDFLDKILDLEAQFVQEQLGKVKKFDNKWILERLFKKDFAERKELTGDKGERLVPIAIFGNKSADAVPRDNSDQ